MGKRIDGFIITVFLAIFQFSVLYFIKNSGLNEYKTIEALPTRFRLEKGS